MSFHNNAYNLLRDPTAIRTRARLRWTALGSDSKPYLVDACMITLDKFQYLPDYEGGAWNFAVRARLIACLELGMSPKDTGASFLEGKISVAQYYLLMGIKHVLESALILTGWLPNAIKVMLDEEASALVGLVLDSFKPATAILKVSIYISFAKAYAHHLQITISKLHLFI